MLAEIVSIGTELLMGEIVDTNSAYLASQLPKLGIKLRWVTKVDDDPERMFEVLDRAWRRSDVTLTSGGLGPTSDDLTRETIARVFGEEMSVQPDLLEHLKGLFSSRGIAMPATNIKQATLIPSAQAIANPLGTAPGWWAEKDGHVIVAMPGPPRELERMWTYEVAPRLKARNPGVAIVTRTIKTFGITEGGVNEMIAPLFKSVNPYLGIYSKPDGIHLRAIATASTEAEARALIAPMEAEIRKALGSAIWGEDEDTPESLAARLLSEKGLTLGVMECFTGGLLASNLSELPDSGRFFRGSIVVTGDDLLPASGVEPRLLEDYGPVSPQVAEAMARAACQRLNASVGIGITGVVTASVPSGPPLGTSYIGFAVNGRASSIRGSYPTHRLRIRSRATTHALLELVRLLRA